jgi:LuxR family transcriptional activator of bioluminescence operon
MPAKSLLDAFDGLACAQSSKELDAEAAKFTRKMGFENFVFALTISTPSLAPKQLVLNGYPQSWVDRYLEKGYFKIDPLVRHAYQTTLPVIWNEGDFQHNAPKEQDFWEEAKSFGLRAGLSFSVHAHSGILGIFSLSRDRRVDLEGQDLAALIGHAQMFANMLHHAVFRIERPNILPSADFTLTARERECMKWAADGKTAWEIGKILGITERTAVFHINNVVKKLGASNKTQAIVRAVSLKLV